MAVEEFHASLLESLIALSDIVSPPQQSRKTCMFESHQAVSAAIIKAFINFSLAHMQGSKELGESSANKKARMSLQSPTRSRLL